MLPDRWISRLGRMALSASALLLIFHISSELLFEAGSTASVEADVRDRVERVSARLDEARALDWPRRPRREAEEVENRFRIDAAPVFPDWTLYGRPFLLRDAPAPPEPPKPHHRAPTGVEARPTWGAVRVSWKGPETNAYAVLQGLEVWRRIDAGAWRLLKRLQPGVDSFRDETGVRAGRVEYRIRSRAGATGDGATLPRELRERESPPSEPVVLHPTILFEPLSVEEGPPSRAQIRIHRWDGNRFIRTIRIVSVGDGIGDTGWRLLEATRQRAETSLGSVPAYRIRVGCEGRTDRRIDSSRLPLPVRRARKWRDE